MNQACRLRPTRPDWDQCVEGAVPLGRSAMRRSTSFKKSDVGMSSASHNLNNRRTLGLLRPSSIREM